MTCELCQRTAATTVPRPLCQFHAIEFYTGLVAWMTTRPTATHTRERAA